MAKRKAVNDNRPPEFDAKLAAHMRLISKMARRYEYQEREEFEQDLLARLIERWDDYDPQFAFSTWIFIVAMNVATDRSRYRQRMCRKAEVIEVTPDTPDSLQMDPTDAIELKRALANLVGTRDGEMLLRYAAGDFLREIATDNGITKERVRQLIERARARVAA